MKKLLTFILGICLIIPCAIMFSGCEEKKPTIDTWNGTTLEVSDAHNGVVTIDSAEELAGLARAVNQGRSFEGETIKLACDMDMANRSWTPIGIGSRSNLEQANAFKGIFDGNGKKIIGLNNKGYIPATENKRLEGDFSVPTYTHQYGLFGITENATIKNLTVTVDFECDDETLKGDSVGGLVGFANKGLVIENCVVNGEIEGYDAIGGLVGRAYNSNETEYVYIKNSTNNADVEAMFKAAGILGYLSSSNLNAVIDGCVNNGDVDVPGMAVGTIFTSRVAGILNYGWNNSSENTLVVKNNTNNGELSVAEELSQDLPNYHAYAYIANSVSQAWKELKHSYNFENNTNRGSVEYLGETVDSKEVLLNQSFPPYSEEFDDTSWNIQFVETIDELKSTLASETNVISLNADLDLKEVNGNTALEITSGKHILDLNGHKIIGVDNGKNSWHAISLKGEATELTIADSSSLKTGTIEGRCYGIQVSRGAKLTIDGGNFICTKNGTYNQSVVVYGGTLVVNGGVFTSKVYETIYGANYTWDSVPYANSITINGGEFNYIGEEDPEYGLFYFEGNNQTVVINGGTFNNNDLEYVVYLEDTVNFTNNAEISEEFIYRWEAE